MIASSLPNVHLMYGIPVLLEICLALPFFSPMYIYLAMLVHFREYLKLGQFIWTVFYCTRWNGFVRGIGAAIRLCNVFDARRDTKHVYRICTKLQLKQFSTFVHTRFVQIKT